MSVAAISMIISQPSEHSQKRLKKAIFRLFFSLFSIYLAPSGAKYREKAVGRDKNWRGWIDKPILELLTCGSNLDLVICACFACFCACFACYCACFAHKKVAHFVNSGFWRLRAPETSIWAPEGALDRNPYIKGPKRQFFHRFFSIFSAVFPYIWPLAQPNIAEKKAASMEKAKGRVRDGFAKPLILEM